MSFALGWPPIRRSAGIYVGVVLVVLGGVLAGAGTAFAHATLVSSSPRSQEVLQVAPTEIALQFTESVDPIEPGIRLIDADGNDIEIGDVDQSAGADTMRAAVGAESGAELAEGTYVIAWQALSADSHRVRGSITFSVGTPTAVSPAVIDGLFGAGAGSESEDALIGAGRLAGYAGVGSLLGGLLMAIVLAPGMLDSRRVSLLLAISAALAVVGTVCMIAVQADLIGGSLLAWGAVADAQSGRWWIARLVVLAACSALVVLRSRLVGRTGIAVTATAGIAVLGVFAAGGHAVSGDAVVLGFVSTVVHLAAMSIWFGGLAIVVMVSARGEFWTTVGRFSPWALGALVALAVTGGLNGWRQLGSLDGITDSAYGRWLVIKIVLVVLVVGVAGFSRRIRRARSDDASGLLKRSIGVELAGIVLILAATAGLVSSPPPVAAAAVSVSAVVGTRVAQVELDPAVTGGTEMHVYITSPSGSLDRADELTVSAELPDRNIASFDIETLPAGVNHVIGTNVDLPVAGLWTFEVAARYGEFDEVVFTVQIPVSGR